MKTGVSLGLRGRERSWRPGVGARGLSSSQQHRKTVHLGGSLSVPSDLGPWRTCVCDRSMDRGRASPVLTSKQPHAPHSEHLNRSLLHELKV